MDSRLRGNDIARCVKVVTRYLHYSPAPDCVPRNKPAQCGYVIPAKAGIHVWTRPDVKDVLKAKRSNAVMYPASANLPCPDGIRAPGPHHGSGLNGLGSPQVFQKLVRPVLPSVHHRIRVGEFTFIKIPRVISSRRRPRMGHYNARRRPPTASSISKPVDILRFSPG